MFAECQRGNTMFLTLASANNPAQKNKMFCQSHYLGRISYNIECLKYEDWGKIIPRCVCMVSVKNRSSPTYTRVWASVCVSCSSSGCLGIYGVWRGAMAQWRVKANTWNINLTTLFHIEPRWRTYPYTDIPAVIWCKWKSCKMNGQLIGSIQVNHAMCRQSKHNRLCFDYQDILNSTLFRYLGCYYSM